MKKFGVVITFEPLVYKVVNVTEEDIDDIMCSAFEGGIGYWACLDNTSEEFENAPDYESYSETCTKILLKGGAVKLIDNEDWKLYTLNLNRLLYGIVRWVEIGGDVYGAVRKDGSLDCGNIDSECADCIIQLALFGEIVYG